MPSRSPSHNINGGIDKLDFDENRKKPASNSNDEESSGRVGLLGDDESLLMESLSVTGEEWSWWLLST